jgi:hypothetical protein
MNAPYYRGNPAISSGHMTPAQVANEMRYIAKVIPADSFRAEDRKAALIQRAADIDAGQVNQRRHFTVVIPIERKKVKGRWVEALTLPCSGCLPYTFDEAWLILEVYAAKRGWRQTEYDGAIDDCYATGERQNMDLGILYDGIADPMRA